MKHLYHLINSLLLVLAIALLPESLASQCLTTFNPDNSFGVSNSSNNFIGQSFTAECSGDLVYVQFYAFNTNSTASGTLNIYSGNTINGSPLYTQTFPSITTNASGDPVRVNITGNVNLVQSSQYTFELSLDPSFIVKADDNNYPNGSAFADGIERNTFDISFEVSITSTLGIENINLIKENITLFPNPSRDSIKINGLTKVENYEIYNAVGQKIREGIVVENEKIDIQKLTNGIYFLKLKKGNTIKFIKE